MSSLLPTVIPFGQASTRHYSINRVNFFPIFSSLDLTFHNIWYIFSKTIGKPGKVRDITTPRVDNPISQPCTLLSLRSPRKIPTPDIHGIYSENNFFQKNLDCAVRDFDHLNRHRFKKALR